MKNSLLAEKLGSAVNKVKHKIVLCNGRHNRKQNKETDIEQI